MWPAAAVVAAAVAGGSSLLAKRLFSHPNNAHNPINPEQQQQQQQQQDQTLEISGVSDNPTNSPIFSPHLAQIPPPQNNGGADKGEEDGLFRFSSSGSPPNSRKSRVFGRSKDGSGSRRREKILGRLKRAGSAQRKNVGKRVTVCLKRRKTSRACTEGGSACSKDQSAFGWGLSLGIMYMMSAGKDEVSKLSRAIDNTAKVVHELKSELNKQKSSHPQQFLGKVGSTNTVETFTAKQANTESSTSNQHSIIMKVITRSADSEYASSVLTDEHQPDDTEMDQLEAELESELQKLPWCANQMSQHEGNINNASEIERCGPMTQGLVTYQSGGVSPGELKHKLAHVLIKQQESHISELESELNLANSKLQEKDAELRALKDCVRRLTEFSLSTVSDEETEACAAKEENAELDSDKNMGSQTAVVGMKRSLGF